MRERPKFRTDLVLTRRGKEEEPFTMVKDPVNHKVYKFEPWEDELVTLMDGTRDVEELAELFDRKHPEMAVDAQWILDYAESLRQPGLLDRTEQEKHLVMMDKVKTLRQRKLLSEESTMFELQFPLFDPDKAMDRIIPWIKWWWSPWYVMLWSVVFLVVLGFLVRHWDVYWAGFFDLFDATKNTLGDWLIVAGLLLLVGIWHELGHAFSVKRWGGEVHDIGFTIFYFEPAFYCRIDDSLMFPRLHDRLWAVAGGPYFEMQLCSVAVAVWLTTPAELWLHDLALTFVLISGLGIVFNANPLVKLDGYFALMDWLDVPDLREESFAYIGNKIKKGIFRLEVPEKAIPRRRRRIYIVYGVVALAYTASILYFLLGIVHRWLVGWLGASGTLLLGGLVLYLSRKKLIEGGRFMRHLWLDKRDLLRARKGKVVAAVVLLALVALLVLPHTATRIEAAFTVEPASRSVIRAPVDGRVESVRVIEGARVTAGQILGTLVNPELAASQEQAAADLERARVETAEARNSGDIASARESRTRALEAENRVRIVTEQIEDLILQAPEAGVVATPQVEDTQGRYLRRGDVFCEIASLDSVRLAIAVPESEVDELAEGAPVRIAATAFPGETLRATIQAIAPVAAEPTAQEEVALDLVRRVNLVRVLVEIDNPEGRLWPGMTGRVQMLTEARSPLGKAWHSFHRWASGLIW